MRSAIVSTLAAALALVAPALAAPANPQPDAEETCTKRSSMLTEWQVVDFNYWEIRTFTTPSHQISSGNVEFQLHNPATDYATNCTAHSDHLDVFFLGDVTYQCNVNASEDPATFTFSRPSGELKINQAWTCPGEGTRFVAKGGVTLDLKCKTEKWTNGNWRRGSLYSGESTKCDHVTTPAPIDSLSVVG